jgi:cell fate regulator YaaT (PSP1 superfamily)
MLDQLQQDRFIIRNRVFVMSERNVVGIRFQQAGKIHYYDPKAIELAIGDLVVVQTKNGLKIAKVVIAPDQVISSEIDQPLSPPVRKATPEDLDQWNRAKGKEAEALSKCKELVTKYELDMKILVAESNLSGDHLTVYFAAPQKVDFRKLARELASHLKAKVEIRQVGPRDASKLLGGIGRCGAPLCCTSFLTEFSPVSVKMAKEQNISLDPTKNSGACGRLLCCLGYESEHYHAMAKKLPRRGQRVQTPSGDGKVVGVNILKETVTVQLEDDTVADIPYTELIRPS